MSLILSVIIHQEYICRYHRFSGTTWNIKSKFPIDSHVKMSVRNYWYTRFRQRLVLFLQGDWWGHFCDHFWWHYIPVSFSLSALNACNAVSWPVGAVFVAILVRMTLSAKIELIQLLFNGQGDPNCHNNIWQFVWCLEKFRVNELPIDTWRC